MPRGSRSREILYVRLFVRLFVRVCFYLDAWDAQAVQFSWKKGGLDSKYMADNTKKIGDSGVAYKVEDPEGEYALVRLSKHALDNTIDLTDSYPFEIGGASESNSEDGHSSDEEDHGDDGSADLPWNTSKRRRPYTRDEFLTEFDGEHLWNESKARPYTRKELEAEQLWYELENRPFTYEEWSYM